MESLFCCSHTSLQKKNYILSHSPWQFLRIFLKIRQPVIFVTVPVAGTKFPERSDFSEKQVTFFCRSLSWSVGIRALENQKPEAACHHKSTVKKQRDMDASDQLMLPFLNSPESLAQGMEPPAVSRSPQSINQIKIISHRHAQRLVSG